MIGSQLREVGDDLRRRHSGCQVLDHVVDGDARAQAAIRWLKDNASDVRLRVDPNKIFATGESAGSIITLGLANRPKDNTGDFEDEGPNWGRNDATIAGAAPFAAGWMMNGPPTPEPYSAPPIAFVQRDWDALEYQGALQGFTRDLMTTGCPAALAFPDEHAVLQGDPSWLQFLVSRRGLQWTLMLWPSQAARWRWPASGGGGDFAGVREPRNPRPPINHLAAANDDP